MNVPVCTVTASVIDLAIDYLVELRGEWSWKEGERAGNAKEYQGLCDFIESMKRIRESAG